MHLNGRTFIGVTVLRPLELLFETVVLPNRASWFMYNSDVYGTAGMVALPICTNPLPNYIPVR